MLVTQKADDITQVEDRSKMKIQHFHLSIVNIVADLMSFLNLTQHSQTSAFLDHIVIRKNLVQIMKFTKV